MNCQLVLSVDSDQKFCISSFNRIPTKENGIIIDKETPGATNFIQSKNDVQSFGGLTLSPCGRNEYPNPSTLGTSATESAARCRLLTKSKNKVHV